MSVIVIGSVAFDSVKTPFGEVEKAIGGSATYFAVAASYFSSVRLVGAVGEDFTDEHLRVFSGRPIDLSGLQRRPGQTFYWKGEYGFDLNQAHTLAVQLNVQENFQPELPSHYRSTDTVFLANTDPELQQLMLEQMDDHKFIACDSMNFWIENKPDQLKKVLRSVDMLLLNEAEARQLAEDPNLVKAAGKIMQLGPKHVIIKRGEYGALLFSPDSVFAAPAYPLEFIYDPTGAGDSFAGGVIGYLDSTGTFSEANLRQAIIFGSVMASYNVVSLERLASLSYPEIEERFWEFKKLSHFDGIESAPCQ